jgi:hypothetical protein
MDARRALHVRLAITDSVLATLRLLRFLGSVILAGRAHVSPLVSGSSSALQSPRQAAVALFPTAAGYVYPGAAVTPTQWHTCAWPVRDLAASDTGWITIVAHALTAGDEALLSLPNNALLPFSLDGSPSVDMGMPDIGLEANVPTLCSMTLQQPNGRSRHLAKHRQQYCRPSATMCGPVEYCPHVERSQYGRRLSLGHHFGLGGHHA